MTLAAAAVVAVDVVQQFATLGLMKKRFCSVYVLCLRVCVCVSVDNDSNRTSATSSVANFYPFVVVSLLLFYHLIWSFRIKYNSPIVRILELFHRVYMHFLITENTHTHSSVLWYLCSRPFATKWTKTLSTTRIYYCAKALRVQNCERLYIVARITHSIRR